MKDSIISYGVTLHSEYGEIPLMRDIKGCVITQSSSILQRIISMFSFCHLFAFLGFCFTFSEAALLPTHRSSLSLNASKRQSTSSRSYDNPRSSVTLNELTFSLRLSSLLSMPGMSVDTTF